MTNTNPQARTKKLESDVLMLKGQVDNLEDTAAELIEHTKIYYPKGARMRKVDYYGYRPVSSGEGENKVHYSQLTKQGQAYFHQWGSDYQEFENGAGNFTTAILELGDGRIISVPAEHIKFVEPIDQQD